MRMGDAETKIEMLISMGKPSGDDNSPGIFDAIKEMQDKLRREFDDKLENLLNRLKK